MIKRLNHIYFKKFRAHGANTPCPRGNAGESIKRMGELISA